VSEPVQSPFGWHLIRVTEVRPETLRPFEEVRAELETELRRQRAGEQLPAFATRLDDEVAAGTPLEAAAERLGVSVLKAGGIDRQGQNEKQEAVAADRLVPTSWTRCSSPPGATHRCCARRRTDASSWPASTRSGRPGRAASTRCAGS
jgi:hypothetical protein